MFCFYPNFCCPPNDGRFPVSLIILFLVWLVPARVFSQDTTSSVSKLKKLTLEELMNIEVTTVTKTPQKLTEVASAIQVVINDVIRRSGAKTLPEALRLAPNLQVAQFNAHDWAITARGFNSAPLINNTLANKLLVMMDGRSIYTPLFGGVLWDVQNAMLEDIDRIEVLSGPGGALWGANAVNGVINIVSKEAKETQGFYATGALGSFLQDHLAARYGGHIRSKVFYRAYGMFFNYRNTTMHDTTSLDSWNMMQGGFRMDYYPGKKDRVTVQGDLYKGGENIPAGLQYASTISELNGQNMLARWTHTFSERSELKVQAYFDRTWRKIITPAFLEDLKTYDIEFQHSFAIKKRQKVLWGGGFRFIQDKQPVTPGTSQPIDKNLTLYTCFVQDQIAIIIDKLQLTIGSKFLSYTYAKFEAHPTARLAWTPSKQHTVWAAVSRAVRVPTRFDHLEEKNPNLEPYVDLESENVIAYELGYRVQPYQRLSISLAGFYNTYSDLRSIMIAPIPRPNTYFSNGQKARSWGVEMAFNYWVKDWWRLRGGYTYLGKKIEATDALALEPQSSEFEAIDPSHQALLQSILDIRKNFQVDIVMRYVSELAATFLTPRVPGYFTFDVRLAYLYKSVEFEVVGQNLAARKHTEFGSVQIPMGIYGRIKVRL